MPTEQATHTRRATGLVPVAADVVIPVITSAVTVTIPDNANTIQLQLDAQAIRFKFDGVNPTTTVGWRASFATADATGWIWIPIPEDAVDWRIIETAATATGRYRFWRCIPYRY